MLGKEPPPPFPTLPIFFGDNSKTLQKVFPPLILLPLDFRTEHKSVDGLLVNSFRIHCAFRSIGLPIDGASSTISAQL